MPAARFDEILKTVWRQTLVENADVVKLGAEHYPVTRSKAKGLRQVTLEYDENTIIGIEQTPKPNRDGRVQVKRLCNLFNTAGTRLS
jgi:hypothetical protein